MSDRLSELRRRLEESVWRGRAEVPSSLRQAAATRGDLPAELATLIDKVHRHAHKVTDDDVAALRGRYSDDALYEIIVSAAVGAAARCLDAGLRALDAAEQEGAGRAAAQG
jgi:hypothetical protein